MKKSSLFCVLKLFLILSIFLGASVYQIQAADHTISGTVYEWCFPLIELDDVYVKLYVVKYPDCTVGEDDLKDTDYSDENGDYNVEWSEWGSGYYTVFISFIKEGYEDIIKYELNPETSHWDAYMLKE